MQKWIPKFDSEVKTYKLAWRKQWGQCLRTPSLCIYTRSPKCTYDAPGIGRWFFPAIRQKWFPILILVFVAITSFKGLALSADPIAPGPSDRCPVCGMYVARYDKWVSTIVFQDGTQVFFDGPKDMFRYYFNLSKYTSESSPDSIMGLYVTEYHTAKLINAKDAYFVIGSDVPGAMGNELVPIRGKERAETFARDHGGQNPLRFREVTPATISELNGPGDHLHIGGYEPIGVMGAHTHHPGGWMISYRYMFMDMAGNRDGRDNLHSREVLADYMVSPTEMTMEMHMLGLMFAPTQNLTLMAMVPYIRMEMDHITRMGVRFTTKSDGAGDFKTTALYHLFSNNPHSLLLNAGLSWPTGSIDEKDDTPAGSNVKLPYPMQLGSGTVDLLPGITYVGQTEGWSWGSQIMATIRLGENSNDYTLGDRIELTGWITREWIDWLSTSLRIDGQVWGNIDGADPDLNPALIPTADPDRRAGNRVDLLLGVALKGTRGKLINHQLAIEGGFPVYQDLDGPQLETDWILTAGWQWIF